MPHTQTNTAADNAIRATAVVTVSGLAALAARISYQHMLLLAERHGEYGIDAHAFPLVGSSRVDLQACKLEYSIVSPK